MAETLKKISYDSIEQFLQDINRNFAVIQNSPLYKGVPGAEGLDGTPGLRGIRGSQFLFVNYAKFNTIFPNELTNASKIDLNFLNLKLLSFANKTKLLEALSVTEFVDKDIIVLTNSIMLSYQNNENKFIDTGIAFNEQSNLVSSIETKIEDYVEFYVSQNSVLTGLKNIFTDYKTYAKNYADTNNTYITTELTASSVYVPYFEGLTSTNGVELTNHRYFGFTDLEFPRENNGTTVFGSIKKYIDLLTATVSITDGQTLTSDYAPGVDNIPSLVVLQDTARAGLMIGRKSKTNLRTFAQIYKNASDELVIQSDSGPDSINPTNDYSKLIISRLKMSFDKLVELKDNLTVNKDLSVLGNINNKFLRTNEFTSDQLLNSIEIGNVTENGVESYTRFVSKNLRYVNFPGQVMVTNSSGDIVKTYSIEQLNLNNLETNILSQITNLPSSSSKIVTSNYINFLMTKFNNLALYLNNLETYLGTSWDTGDFTLENVAINGAQQNAFTTITNIPSSTKSKVVTSDYLNFIFNKFNNLESYLSNYINTTNQYLTTTWDTSDFTLENIGITGAQAQANTAITNIPSSTKSKVVTSDYLNFIFNKFNNIETWFSNNLQSINQYITTSWDTSDYLLENATINSVESAYPATITSIPASSKSRVITSDYMNFLMTKFNNLQTWLNTKFDGVSVGSAVLMGNGDWLYNNFLYLNATGGTVTKTPAQVRSLLSLGNAATYNFTNYAGGGDTNEIARGNHTLHYVLDLTYFTGIHAVDVANPASTSYARVFACDDNMSGFGPGIFQRIWTNVSGSDV